MIQQYTYQALSSKVTTKNIDPDESPNKFSCKRHLLQCIGGGGEGKGGEKEGRREGR